MADTAFLRTKLLGQIQATEAHLRQLKEKLAAVEAVERLDQEMRGERPTELPSPLLQALIDLRTAATTADAAVAALKELGGQGHGKDILPRVLKLKNLAGDHQMEALGAAMTRDPRIEKVGPNLWKLMKGA